jgi:hypothetical protein
MITKKRNPALLLLSLMLPVSFLVFLALLIQNGPVWKILLALGFYVVFIVAVLVNRKAYTFL